MSLATRLARDIAQAGPISVADYMDRCLHDPRGGYYATRPKLGGRGDFITAPHVSQMFGELLGLWAADVWERLGRPPRVRVVELGPGDGVMMTDILRAAKASPAFLAACEVWLVETSAPLVSLQASALSCAPAPIRWAQNLAAVPADAPLIVLANEFLDCLPIRQAVKTQGGWVERRVGVDRKGWLTFQSAGWASPDGAPPDAPPGAIAEWSEDLAALGQAIGKLIHRASGAALFIDYGRDALGSGDTLQALRGHRKESPLARPGEADLTAHVDFAAFLAAARDAGALAAAIVSQGDFLRALGIETRAAALAGVWPEKGALIGRQLARLIAPDQMGDLFKAACVHSPGVAPPGFEVRR
jgi:NADH dehydrogenase [ubiquinone] 1 alpha subcomplex assembly factor 7